MKKSTFLKLTLAFPALALVMTSCSKDPEPYIESQMISKAIQKEIKTDGVVSTVFVPNIIGQAASNVRIINPMITKDNVDGSLLKYFTQYTGHAETYIDSETNYKSSLAALNGVYYFIASSEDGKKVRLSTQWNFDQDGNQAFVSGWGEFDANPANNKIKTFSYLNGKIELKFKPLTDEAATVKYYMIVMQEEDTGYETRLAREWWGANSNDLIWPIDLVPDPDNGGEMGHLIMGGFNASRFDGKKVFLAAEKAYGNALIVTLLSSPKTINIERGAFTEDPEPEELDPSQP